ncbi:hypothetical protein [Methylomonas fluvii]|nr:hypothetical protein [Methylomonas fluvii]
MVVLGEFSWCKVGANAIKIRPVVLRFVVAFYFEVSHQCPAGIKKGLAN